MSVANWRSLKPFDRSLPNSHCTFDNFLPHGFGRRVGANHFLAAVAGAVVPRDPAVALHAVQDADQRRRLDHHLGGQFGLRQLAFQRKPAEHHRLAIGDAVRRQLVADRAMIGLGRERQPVADAFFEVVMQHGSIRRSDNC